MYLTDRPEKLGIALPAGVLTPLNMCHNLEYVTTRVRPLNFELLFFYQRQYNPLISFFSFVSFVFSFSAFLFFTHISTWCSANRCWCRSEMDQPNRKISAGCGTGWRTAMVK